MTFNTYLDVIQARAIANSAQGDEPKGITYIQSANENHFVSYHDLYQIALQTLQSFHTLGIKQGDALILFINDNPRFLQAFWAALLGGIVPVPVAVGISDEHRAKLLKIMQRFENAWLWTDGKSAELLDKYLQENNAEASLASSRRIIAETFQIANDAAVLAAVTENDVAFIQFSSGSTRDPKGVVLTHKNLITTNLAMGNRLQYTPEDSSLSWMPLTHDLGLIGFHLNMLVFDMQQALMPTDSFSRRPLQWLQKAAELKSTILTSPNFGFKHVLKLYNNKPFSEDIDLSNIRAIVNGAEPISIQLCDEFNQTMVKHGLKDSAIVPSYGLAEAALAVSLSEPGKPFRAVNVDRNTLTIGGKIKESASGDSDVLSFAIEGFPVENCEVGIFDLDGNALAEQTVGEVGIKGPNVTAGYLNEDVINADLFTKDGFLKTGDLGFLQHGEVVITGRLKDIIFVSGLNYYPHDVETVALDLAEEFSELELGKIVACGARRANASEDDILVCVLYRGELTEFNKLASAIKTIINRKIGIEIHHVLPVKRIPKTTSGKVQRRFFVDAYLNGEFDQVISELADLNTENIQFENENTDKYQIFIKHCCETTLSGKQLNANDNFFDSGVTSLEMAQIHEQIDTKYPDQVDIMDIFDHPSIQDLSQFLRSKDTQG